MVIYTIIESNDARKIPTPCDSRLIARATFQPGPVSRVTSLEGPVDVTGGHNTAQRTARGGLGYLERIVELVMVQDN